MRVAIDVSQMCYTGTGVGRYMSGLAEALLTLPGNDRFTFYAGALRQRPYFKRLSARAPWREATWKIWPIPPRAAGWLFNTLDVPFEWFTGRADLVHTADWSQPHTSVPTVTTVHDLIFRKHAETVDPQVKAVQEKRLARVVASGTYVIVDSKSTKTDLMKIYNLDSSRIFVVYPGIDQSLKPSSKKEVERVKKKYHLQRYLMTLGTREPRKNLARVVEAFTLLRKDPAWADVSLVVTGREGWGRQLEANAGVVTTGFISDRDVYALLSGAEVFVYPSLYEGFGFPVLEAMACGAPVVTSDVSSLPEVAGNAAVLVHPLDSRAIAKGIATAAKNAAKLRVLGRARAKLFNWVNTAQEVRNVYSQVFRHWR